MLLASLSLLCPSLLLHYLSNVMWLGDAMAAGCAPYSKLPLWDHGEHQATIVASVCIANNYKANADLQAAITATLFIHSTK